MTRRVLFLCTGNSCRSQMAEAIVNHRFADSWQASSAGTKPSGYVHPIVLQVLDELGIQHNGYSKHVDIYRSAQFDLVITVCDSASEECPVWLEFGKRIHMAYPDPAEVRGTVVDKLRTFRKVRDTIDRDVINFLKSIKIEQ